ncbi:MBL fold metallo-hydrolase [Kyrpidia tusciae]|uniref:Beta-lactamase domain protein n=1 Tax=Kyrpidia tusciae (strain DSM 2912 / NBRC 15312 / T2) TaxID=562970 RepID=D5WSA1_KYRT2|nr:MBL fold metallo-hydrolase [Kyrpidia tusciae]ADG04986.1 beta-lactamase domain protein [Kyrpidia tusciae DSM 2912]
MNAAIRPISLTTPFPVGAVNAFLLRDDPVTLVDVGPKLPDAWEGLADGLRRAGCEWRDIEYVVITHPHVDHHGLLSRVLDASGATALVHPDAERRVLSPRLAAESEAMYFEPFLTASGVPEEIRGLIAEHQRLLQEYVDGVDEVKTVEIGARLELGGREWRVLDTPGHSSGHLSLFDEEEGDLIAGDHLLPHISSNALLEAPRHPGGERARSLIVYMEALNMVAALPVKRVYPGHGEVFTGAAELVDRRLRGYERRCSQLLGWLGERPHTVFELVRRMFPRLSRGNWFLAVSEIVGHLDVLQARGQVGIEERRGLWYYRVEPGREVRSAAQSG